MTKSSTKYSISPSNPTPTRVISVGSVRVEMARNFAERFDLVLIKGDDHDDTQCRFILEIGSEGLSLQDLGQPGSRPLQLNVDSMKRFRSGRDLLARSVGRNSRTIVDATAGFGYDAFHLFQLGKQVTAVERSSVVAAMLSDMVDRLVPKNSTGSLQVIYCDARQLLSECERPDVVYLDPMFPDRATRSARAGKSSQILQALVGETNDTEELFLLARSVALQRVVVKRPVWAAPFAANPDMEYRGQVVRYDTYVTHR